MNNINFSKREKITNASKDKLKLEAYINFIKSQLVQIQQIQQKNIITPLPSFLSFFEEAVEYKQQYEDVLEQLIEANLNYAQELSIKLKEMEIK